VFGFKLWGWGSVNVFFSRDSYNPRAKVVVINLPKEGKQAEEFVSRMLELGRGGVIL
jgi:hypothetical protein